MEQEKKKGIDEPILLGIALSFPTGPLLGVGAIAGIVNGILLRLRLEFTNLKTFVTLLSRIVSRPVNPFLPCPILLLNSPIKPFRIAKAT
jgi:hypothetical protein